VAEQEKQHITETWEVFQCLGEYVKAKEYLEKGLAITMEIDDRAGEATCYENLGSVFLSLGEYVKAKEYLEKALTKKKEIGDKAGEGRCYGSLGGEFSPVSVNMSKLKSISRQHSGSARELVTEWEKQHFTHA